MKEPSEDLTPRPGTPSAQFRLTSGPEAPSRGEESSLPDRPGADSPPVEESTSSGTDAELVPSPACEISAVTNVRAERSPTGPGSETRTPLTEEEICQVMASPAGEFAKEGTGVDASEVGGHSSAEVSAVSSTDPADGSTWWAHSVPQPKLPTGGSRARLLLWGLLLGTIAAGAIAFGLFWDQFLTHLARLRALSSPPPFSEIETEEEPRGSAFAQISSRSVSADLPQTATVTPKPWEVRVQEAAELLRLPPKLPETAEEFNREAYLVCEHLIEDLPERPEALALAAMFHNRQGKYQEAEKLWKKALELNPNFAPAYNGLGWLAARRDALDEAAQYLRKAVQLDPYAGHSHSLLVDVLLRQNKMEEALVAARTYVAHFPKAGDSNYWLGQALLQLGQLEEAEKAYLAAIEFEPDYTAAYHSLSTVCARLGQREEAKKWRAKFAELKEKDMEADRQRTRQYQDLPTQQRLAANYHLAAGNVHTSFGDPRKAEAHWIRGSAIAPHTIECRLALAEFYERTQRLVEAHEQWQVIVRQPSPLPGHWYRKGEVEKRLGLFAEAEQSYRQAAALAPQAPEPYIALVDLVLQYGRPLEDAPALAEKAVELAPTPHTYFALSAVREMRGDVDGALQALEEALRREPSHPLLQVAYKELQERQAKTRPQRSP